MDTPSGDVSDTEYKMRTNQNSLKPGCSFTSAIAYQESSHR